MDNTHIRDNMNTCQRTLYKNVMDVGNTFPGYHLARRCKDSHLIQLGKLFYLNILQLQMMEKVHEAVQHMFYMDTLL